MNTRPPSNAAAIKSLEDQGYNVRIQHFRRVPIFQIENSKWEKKVIPDFEWRKYLFTNYYDLPDENGGATEITLKRGEEKIVVRADCYVKDRFCRRIGVSYAMKKLESLYGIK